MSVRQIRIVRIGSHSPNFLNEVPSDVAKAPHDTEAKNRKDDLHNNDKAESAVDHAFRFCEL